MPALRTHAEFSSPDFPACPGEDEQINPGIFGKKLAEFLAQGLPGHGFPVVGIGHEDWGWIVELENEAFRLWVGCANYEEFENGFLCFVEPSKPVVRKWFTKIDTVPTVERLASAIEALLQGSGKVSRFRWWSRDEART